MIIPRDTYLNKLIAHKHNQLIKIITGLRRCGKSLLSKDIITEFRGRGDEIHLYPLSVADYASVHPELSWEDAWNQYWKYGGLPYVATLNSDEEKTNQKLQ